MPGVREKVQIFQFLTSEKHVLSTRPANVEKVPENRRKVVRPFQYVLNKKTNEESFWVRPTIDLLYLPQIRNCTKEFGLVTYLHYLK